MEPTTEEGKILGTPACMSPKQAEGKPLDARSDIFSFGAVLDEMITGRRAFAGDTTVFTLAAVIEGFAGWRLCAEPQELRFLEVSKRGRPDRH